MKEVLLILLGAVVTGVLQLIVGVYDRRREAETILTAIAAEVDAICRLIRHRQYAETISAIAKSIKNNNWDGSSVVIDVRENYFSVYEGLAPKLGMLKPDAAAKIVNFYAYCKSLIDSFRVDGPNAQGQNAAAAENILAEEALFAAVLNLGDEIVDLPRVSLQEAVPHEGMKQIEKILER
jgi:hypothetical protein